MTDKEINKLLNKTNKQLNKAISDTAQETATTLITELRKHGLMKNNRYTPFQKTEQLLYNYNSFREVIKKKNEQIKYIQEAGLQKKSKSITSWSGNNLIDTETEEEKAEEKIKKIESSIRITKNFISIIDQELQTIANDPYYGIIVLKYFEGKTRDEIAEYFGVDASTISRNKSRLINMLKVKLFSDEVIYEMFC